VSRYLRSVAGDQGVEELFVERNVDLSMLGFARPMGQAASRNDGDSFFASRQVFSQKLPKGEASFRCRHRCGQGVDDDGYHGNSHVGIEKMQRQHGGVVEEEFVGERWIKTAIETGSE